MLAAESLLLSSHCSRDLRLHISHRTGLPTVTEETQDGAYPNSRFQPVSACRQSIGRRQPASGVALAAVSPSATGWRLDLARATGMVRPP